MFCECLPEAKCDTEAASHRMRLFVDALSVNNLSGAYVLSGHLHQILQSGMQPQDLCIVTHQENRDWTRAFPDRVRRVEAQASQGWWSRFRWARRNLQKAAQAFGADVAFNPSGMMSAGLGLPQVVLAQNPWPIIGPKLGAQDWRLRLQLWGFGRAQRKAARMVFNSRYMQHLYASEFGSPVAPAVLAYQGIPDSRFGCAVSRLSYEERRPRVLCVSVMGRHKAIEVLVDAFAKVAASLPNSELVIAGGWPDQGYRREIDARVAEHALADRIRILGHVSDAELDGLYASSRAFCLLSRCESFGIPAAEAQAFGTPCVVADGTAAPEIIGQGGVAVPADNADAAASALILLLADPSMWAHYSELALGNVERFRWASCSRPLIEAIHEVAAAGSGRATQPQS